MTFCVWEKLVDSKTSTSFESGFCQIDVFITIATETERLENARPLTCVRSDSEDEDPLIPDNFLIGPVFPNIPACVFNENPSLKTKYCTQTSQ